MTSVDLTIPAILDRTNKPTLDELAHEINVRLQKADDHRLSASLKLAEAKEACATAGISFKSWVAKEIKQISYPEAARLAKIGGAEDPAKALEDLRQKTKASKTATTKKSALRSAPPTAPTSLPSPRPAGGKAAIRQRVREANAALSGLPPAAEVVAWLRGTDDGALVDERLPAASVWLTEFSTLWGNE